MTRYTRSPEAIHLVRTARRQRQCDGDWAHDRTIRPGDRYTLSKLPPGTLGNLGWWRMALCVQCLEIPVNKDGDP